MKKGIIGILILTILFTGCATNIKDGVSYLEEGKYEEAITSFQAEIDEEKNLAEANRGMALAYYELGSYMEAVSYFEEALANETEETASLYHLMGTCCIQYGDYEGAIAHYEKSMLLEDCTDEMKKEMLFNKVVAYEKLMDWESARIAADYYLSLYPEDENMMKEAEFLETR